MKKLSDYKGEEAIDLWADLMTPATEILSDEKVASVMKSGKPPLVIVRTILKYHQKEASEILIRIDPTPVNGLNIITRLVSLINEFYNDSDIQAFFDTQGQKIEQESSGSATESTEESETSDSSSVIAMPE